MLVGVLAVVAAARQCRKAVGAVADTMLALAAAHRHYSLRPPTHPLQAISAGMFLDALPKTLTPLGLAGAGAADVQSGLRKALRAVLDVQGPIRRLADTVERAVAEQAAYLQRAQESERAGEWNQEVRGLWVGGCRGGWAAVGG